MPPENFREPLVFCHFQGRVSTESWQSWESWEWEIEQTVWEIHGVFISCILENSIWFLLNTLLEVCVAESIKLTLLTYLLVG